MNFHGSKDVSCNDGFAHGVTFSSNKTDCNVSQSPLFATIFLIYDLSHWFSISLALSPSFPPCCSIVKSAILSLSQLNHHLIQISSHIANPPIIFQSLHVLSRSAKGAFRLVPGVSYISPFNVTVCCR